MIESKNKIEALRISNVTVKYGLKTVLKDISFGIEENEFLGIIGPNGGGKTTLLKSILGLKKIDNGNISIYDKAPGKTRKLIGYVPQHSDLNKNFPITVKEVVAMSKLNSKISYLSKNKDYDEVYESLNKVCIYNLKDRQVSELSDGEFQKMLIARALTINPKILLLDEPTASVDANSRIHIFDLLKELNKDITIILVTHDLLAVSSHVKKLLCLNGIVIYHGQSEINQKVLNELYGCSIDLLLDNSPSFVTKEVGIK